MAKHTHVIIFNKMTAKPDVEYVYKFGHTENIKLALSKNGCSISADLNRIYDEEEMLSSGTHLFPDAFKKILLLYLIRYSKALEIKSITFKIDDEEETQTFNSPAHPPIYSMINGNLRRNIPTAFTANTVSNHLLNTPKTKYDSRIASLFAFLCSKSKSYETERFIYLWTSFNAIYGFLSDIVAKAHNVDKYRREHRQIIIMQELLDVGSATINDADKTPIANQVIAILKDVNPNTVCKNDFENTEISEKITTVLSQDDRNYNLSPYGYLLTQFSYYFRCKIIHGSKPIFLFSYDNDREVHSLKIINALLEEFINAFLPSLFDENYINETIRIKAQTIH